MDGELITLLVASAAAFLGGLSRGLLGFGGALILAPALALLVEPLIMVPLIMLVDLPANVGLVRSVWPQWNRRICASISLGTLAGLPLGLLLLLSIDSQILARIVFVIIILAALLLLSGWRFGRQLKPLSLIVAGAINGMTLGATSIAAGMVPVLYGGGTSMAEARANMIIWMSVTGPLLVVIIAVVQGLAPPVLSWALLLAPIYLLGVFAGARGFRRVDEALFRKLVLIALLAAGLFGLMKS